MLAKTATRNACNPIAPDIPKKSIFLLWVEKLKEWLTVDQAKRGPTWAVRSTLRASRGRDLSIYLCGGRRGAINPPLQKGAAAR